MGSKRHTTQTVYTMKRITVLLMMLSALVVYGQKSQIGGKVQGVPSGSKMLLLNVVGNKLHPSDTLALGRDGSYKANGNATGTDFFVMQLLLPDKSTQKSQQFMVHVMLHPGEKVQMDLEYMPTISMVKVASVKGSNEMELYRKFNNLLVEATLEPDQGALLGQNIAQLLSEGKNNLMSAFLVTFFDNDFTNFAGLYNQIREALKPQYATHDFVRYLDSKLQGVLTAGMAAPDIVMKDRDGNERKLSSLRGKVVLLDFWASWCRPCRMENPNVVRLYEQYHDKGFEIFSVSMDNSKESWLKAIKDDGLVWPNHVSDLKGWTSSGGKTYGISSIPATVLIAPDGTIIARNLRGHDLEKALQQIFDTK